MTIIIPEFLGYFIGLWLLFETVHSCMKIVIAWLDYELRKVKK